MDEFAFGDTPSQISTEDLKHLIHRMRQTYSEYESKKEIANKAREKYEELEQKVIDTLRAAGLKRFDVPGIGTCTVATKFSVRVPKDIEAKRQLFKYIREHNGSDVLDEFRTINYQTLNAWFNKEAEANGSEKKDFSIPGIDTPTEDNYLQFRGERPGGDAA